MGLGLFYQLLTSPKLPLIIFVRLNLINHLVGFISYQICLNLKRHASWSTTGQKVQTTIQLVRGLNSQLSQVTRPSRQPALF